MRPTRGITVSLLALSSVMAFASASDELTTPSKPIDPAAAYTTLKPQAAVIGGAAVAIFGKPTVGIRVGLGSWNNLNAEAGIDVTFKLPIIPLPALRIDYEAWTELSNWGDRHGNALSILGLQNFAMFYAGIGPSYYFSDDEGDHRSGFGAKLLVGTSLPGGAFVEAGGIVGEAPIPIFISIGKRF